jgi:hypothetical protein
MVVHLHQQSFTLAISQDTFTNTCCLNIIHFFVHYEVVNEVHDEGIFRKWLIITLARFLEPESMKQILAKRLEQVRPLNGAKITLDVYNIS